MSISLLWRQQKPQWVSQPIHHRIEFRTHFSPAASESFFAPFLAPLLVDLGRCPGQSISQNVFPHTLPVPPAKPGVHAFPRGGPLRQIPPGYPCPWPIQDSIEHYPAALFGRQHVFHFIPLFVCQFMSFRAPSLLLFLYPLFEDIFRA